MENHIPVFVAKLKEVLDHMNKFSGFIDNLKFCRSVTDENLTHIRNTFTNIIGKACEIVDSVLNINGISVKAKINLLNILENSSSFYNELENSNRRLENIYKDLQVIDKNNKRVIKKLNVVKKACDDIFKECFCDPTEKFKTTGENFESYLPSTHEEIDHQIDGSAKDEINKSHNFMGMPNLSNDASSSRCDYFMLKTSIYDMENGHSSESSGYPSILSVCSESSSLLYDSSEYLFMSSENSWDCSPCMISDNDMSPDHTTDGMTCDKVKRKFSFDTLDVQSEPAAKRRLFSTNDQDSHSSCPIEVNGSSSPFSIESESQLNIPVITLD